MSDCTPSPEDELYINKTTVVSVQKMGDPSDENEITKMIDKGILVARSNQVNKMVEYERTITIDFSEKREPSDNEKLFFKMMRNAPTHLVNMKTFEVEAVIPSYNELRLKAAENEEKYEECIEIKKDME